MPSSDSPGDLLLEQLAEDFVERHRRGEHPALSEYISRHPDIAAEIRDLFPALIQVEKLKPAPGDLTGAFVPTSGHAAEHVPERLGEFRILREIGQGGMGVVYEAEQESLGRHVALKVLPRHALFKTTYLERFRREAKAAGRLHHTNIVPVFGVGECDGTHYFAMQYIPGEGLDKVLHDLRRLRNPHGAPTATFRPTEGSVAHSLLSGRFTEAPAAAVEGPSASCTGSVPALTERTHGSTALSSSGPEGHYFRGVARVAVQVADALAYAHRQGILHRDIKPSNLLLDQQGTVWITDFGLAKAEGADDLTQTGDIVGTVRFMAPERFDGRSLPQSDVYALGVTLYEMLTLRPAFDDVNKARLVEKVLHEPPVSPRRIDPSIPRDLETVVLKCLAKDPAERYANAEVLAEDLRRFLADRPILARRSNWRERTWRWCRRNPVVAVLLATVALLLTVTAVGGVVMALQLKGALGKAQQAEREGKRKLLESYVSEADATRMSGQVGQRFGTLRRIRDALALSGEIGLRDEDKLRLRNIAIAALCLPDAEVGLEWPADPAKPLPEELDPDLRRRTLAGYALDRVPPPAHMLRSPSWYSPDGRFIAVGLQPYINGKREWTPARVWRIDGPTPVPILDDPEGPLQHSTAFRPDSRQVAFGHRDGTVSIYDTETGQLLRRLGPVRGEIQMVAYHPRLPRLAAASGTEVFIWEIKTGQLLLRVRPASGAYYLAWHPRGHRLAIAGDGFQLCDADTGQLLTETYRQYSNNGGTQVAFNHAGDCVASINWSGVLRLRDAVTGRQLLRLPGSWEPDRLRFGSDDRWLGLRETGNRYQVLRVAAGQELRVLHRSTPQGLQRLDDVAIHPEGRLLAVTTRTGLGFLDLRTCEEVTFLSGNFRGVGFDRTGALWTSGAAGFLRWPVQTSAGAANRLRVGPPEWVANIPGMGETGYFSDDGRVAVVPLLNAGALVVHRGASCRIVRLGPQYDVRAAPVSPDGRWVVTGSHHHDGSGVKWKVWKTDTGKLVANLPFPDVSGCPGFSPDSRWLYVTGKEDRRLEVASLAASPVQAAASATPGPSPWQGEWRSQSVKLGGAFSPDNRVRAYGTQVGAIRLVSPDTDEEIARLQSPEVGWIDPAAFTADGSCLLARGQGTGSLYVFDLRRIREQLAKLGLDWDEAQPPLPTRTDDSNVLGARLQVELIDAEWATSREKMNQYEGRRAVARLYFNPFDADAHYRLGSLQLEGGRFAQAYTHLTVALAFGLKLDGAYSLRAEAALRLRRWDDAAADATRYLEKYPYDTFIRHLRAEANHRRKHGAEAVADLTSVIASYPYDAALYERRAECHEALGQAKKAAADREKAFKLRANDPTWLNNQAWQLVAGPVAKRDPARALALIQKAIEREPDNASFLNTLGVALYRSRQYAAAIASLEKSLAAGQGRSDGFNLFFLAMCHARRRNMDSAKDCFDRAVKWVQGRKDLNAPFVAELKAFRTEAEGELRAK
jgi:serine/threonine protein kinase/WD40 repeat protein/tetratricopeptide (TPR) repeat protein